MKRIKRLTILALVFVMAVCMLLPASAFAAPGGEASGEAAASVSQEGDEQTETTTASLSSLNIHKKGYVRVKLYADSSDGEVAWIAYSVGGKVTYCAPGISDWLAIPHGKETTIKVWGTNSEKTAITDLQTISVTSKLLPKSKITCATAINKNMVSLHWKKSASKATGYYIYANGKKVKTVKGHGCKCKVKLKNAAKKKYKVVPYIVSNGKAYRGRSCKAKKPAANTKKFKNSIDSGDYTYDVSCRYIIKKITLEGKKYHIQGYVVNTCKYLTALDCKKISITIKCDGNVVAKKTFKNVTVNLKPGKSKRKDFVIKGKAGKDIRSGGGWVTDFCPITYE